MEYRVKNYPMDVRERAVVTNLVLRVYSVILKTRRREDSGVEVAIVTILWRDFISHRKEETENDTYMFVYLKRTQISYSLLTTTCLFQNLQATTGFTESVGTLCVSATQKLCSVSKGPSSTLPSWIIHETNASCDTSEVYLNH